jgi:O-antigen/teichoic acid export membrane protein
MLSYPFFASVILNVRLLNANNKDKITARIYALNMLVSLMFHLLIIPKFAGEGAAYVRLVSTIMLSVLCFLEVYKLFPGLNIKSVVLQSIVATSVMTTTLFLIRSWSLFVIIGLGAVFYFITLFIIHAITKEEIKLIKSFFSNQG